MLTEKEILEKLYSQPKIFSEQYFLKKYSAAAMTEFVAHVVATFIELDEEQMIELFGRRKNDRFEEEVVGLFPEEQVIDANWQTCLHFKSINELNRREKREREEAWIESQKKQ